MKKLYNLYKEYYSFFYVAMLSITVAVMPHSRGLLSSSLIGLAFIWLLEANFKRKFEILIHNKAILILISIFLIHIIGLIYTNNFDYAIRDLKIKLPLLLFPLVIGTSTKLGFKEIKIIITVFTISIFAKTIYGIVVLTGITGEEINNIQRIAGKFSHIRYSLLLNIVIYSNLYILVFSPDSEYIIFKILRIIVIIWLSIFIFILHSVTGWVIFLSLFLFSGLFISLSSNYKLLKIIGLTFSISIFIFISSYLIYTINKFNKKDIIEISTIDTKTLSGNTYVNNFESQARENEHFVGLYLCEKELKMAWNNVSEYKYTQKDEKNQYIKFTLIRYLTSKNLRKDKEGVQKLSKQDIKNIEIGLTNYIFENKYSLYPKLYEILWQFERYFSGGSPEKHSVTQRFEFLRIGKEIIKQNFWFGVGTGDVKDEFSSQYEISSSKLTGDYRLRAHNQYVTFLITFGFFGFLWFLFAYIYPAVKEKKFKDYLFLVVFITMSFSMLNEDTLETQMGATAFAFFISLYLFSSPLEIIKGAK